MISTDLNLYNMDVRYKVFNPGNAKSDQIVWFNEQDVRAVCISADMGYLQEVKLVEGDVNRFNRGDIARQKGVIDFLFRIVPPKDLESFRTAFSNKKFTVTCDDDKVGEVFKLILGTMEEKDIPASWKDYNEFSRY